MNDLQNHMQRAENQLSGSLYSTRPIDAAPLRGMTFVNPANGHREDVGDWAVPLTAVFGPLYLAYRGLWGATAVYVIVAAVLAAALGSAVLVAAPVLSVAFSVAVRSLIRTHYQRSGWRDVADVRSDSVALPQEGPGIVPVAPSSPAVTPTATVVPTATVADGLERLVKMREAGHLTDDEFKASKAKLLQ